MEGGNAQVYQKSFFESCPVLLAVRWAMRGGEGMAEGGKVEGRQNLVPKDVLWPLCLLNKLTTFWFFTC